VFSKLRALLRKVVTKGVFWSTLQKLPDAFLAEKNYLRKSGDEPF
jgi:hypothetical protein